MHFFSNEYNHYYKNFLIILFDQQILTSVKRIFQDAVSCATTQLEDTSVLAWQDTHFWEMAVIVLVNIHALPTILVH